MSLSAIVYSKPGCPGCHWVKAHLGEFGVPYTEYDVTSDAAAFDRLRDIFDDLRRGQPLSVPVTIITSDLGVETVFGPAIRSSLKQHARASAATQAA